MSRSINPYGDGNASVKIVDSLLNYFIRIKLKYIVKIDLRILEIKFLDLLFSILY